MGRKKASLVRLNFDTGDNIQKCKICSQIMTGSNITNMARHIERKHPNVYTEIQMESSDDNLNVFKKKKDTKNIVVAASENLLWEGCLEMATKGGLPLSFISNSGFKKVIEPLTAKLNIERQLNVTNLKAVIYDTAKQIKIQIKNETKDKLLSIKIDAVTRQCRSLLGINVQYILNEEIVIKTLAIKELQERHTGYYIKNVILDVLKEYNIALKQIYCVTSDNGRNMIKATNLLREQLETEIIEESDDSDDDNTDNEDQENVINLNEVEDLISKESNGLVNCIRCAAHTLQLVVSDALKEANLSAKISECRRLAVALRKPNICIQIKAQNKRMPKLNVPTRWNSSYDMIERLLELHEFCQNNANDSELHVPDELWQFMTTFVESFKPLKITTMQLQNEQMSLSDFYKYWLKLKIELSKISSTIATSVAGIIKKREEHLLQNPVYLSALYLDPRFKFLLSSQESEIAQKHLIQLSNYIAQTGENRSDPELHNSISNTSTDSNMEIENDELSNYLNEREIIQLASSAENDSEKRRAEIQNFNPERIKNHGINILMYWKIKSNEYPTLSKLARTIYAVPATQVSVERSFSALKFILSDERNRLSSHNLENILLVRLNNKFT